MGQQTHNKTTELLTVHYIAVIAILKNFISVGETKHCILESPKPKIKQFLQQ